jgi:Collagen-flanked surface repeat
MNGRYWFALTMTAVLGCGDAANNEAAGRSEDGEGDTSVSTDPICKVDEQDDGSKLITCDDGTRAIVRDGEDGSSCSVKDNENGTATISCTDGTSATVSDGEMGQPGRDGREGFSVSKKISCGGTVERDGTLLYGLSYQVVEYTTGAVFVTCSISNAASEASASEFYDANQIGARSRGCNVTMDDTPSFGYWSFKFGSSGYAATYNDSSSTNDGYTLSFDGVDALNNGCTTFTP